MNKEQAISNLRQGKIVECSFKEYHDEIRTGLQDFAAKMIDHNQTVYAMIALNEVKRLDVKFGPPYENCQTPPKAE